MKKIVETNEESEVKAVIKNKMGKLFIEEYIFGSLETKSILLNIFKNLVIKP